MRPIRAGIQMVFQDPYESLDPRQTVFDLVAEPLTIHGTLRGSAERRDAVLGALSAPDSSGRGDRATLSAPSLRRTAAARGARLRDGAGAEPRRRRRARVDARRLPPRRDPAADARALREQRNLSYLFITHDLSLAWVVADRIAVVYLGRIVEVGPAAEVIGEPRHPYTKALVSVIPVPRRGAIEDQIVLQGRDAVGAQRPLRLPLPSSMLAL